MTGRLARYLAVHPETKIHAWSWTAPGNLGDFMDPNETLRLLRETATLVLTDSGKDRADSVRLAELAEALDGWISKGGFLPAAWARPASTGPEGTR